MIHVIYYREHNRVTIEGHAKSDEYGRDLICAAASALAVTLSANVRHMADIGCVTEPVIRLEEGSAEISCKPRTRYKAIVRHTFMSLCMGFEILANKYPEYETYQIRG